ncbi:16S rRNA (cytosine(967)-C(5))-methyltransferase RsmB [Pseudidiomarina terrestris]|uniref:16S rRNA (cytosine(967)-C(5))-methyltransferase RsmB n=1 Tax=Pseudidiomarina terrestris TaxID=2820060 RepID=UPI0026554C8A|nr:MULTISPECIES: 16S rRNA (cytosine(967)-C(5))-methyltransferase RsmB [unclassified Pseudidiomarina]MDN7128006.1 16S rRNA (cytosine(967)-C(5))-methyltransferase RsmB [Pseudidiomarina sp. 1APR75-33.1]MDN7135665.1 16S rRNA (cytosine(967)-C(5))-methyltransferase RsmB [Pseudidiomarina sp. 1ASP75-5]
MSKGANSRAAAAKVLAQVLEHGRSMSQALPEHTGNLESRDRAMVQSLCFGVLRNLPLLNAALARFLDKPLKKDLFILHYLLLVGAYQLLFMGTSDHAAVSATVDATELLKKRRQKGLINAVLRNLQRQRQSLWNALNDDPELRHGHPRWLADTIRAAYPEQAEAIFAANNVQAPMWLRVNTQQISVAEFRQALEDYDPELLQPESIPALPTALKLQKAVDVRQLPGFADGWFSVQDCSAQYAAYLLAPQPGQRVLDCCAAPGGKTAHILEQSPSATVHALDVDAERLQRVEENLTRLQHSAQILTGDAARPEQWWDGELYDRILLDAPCSATGVIRRHPDIKWLRRAKDISALAQTQAALLDALWPLLRPGGRLVYATCSIVSEENSEQVKAFCQRQHDALPIPTAPDGATSWQRLPGEQDGDGFFYAIVEKQQ